MDTTLLSRTYLESVSTADLLVMADDYGIDIPDNLNRRFIIGELLEMAEEMEAEEEAEGDVQLSTENVEEPDALPRTYNETRIHALLHTPAWAFVFWDIRETELRTIKTDYDFGGLFLHIAFFSDAETEKCGDSFDIKIAEEDREQYVLIPGGKKSFTISLNCAVDGSQPLVLAHTGRIEVPEEEEALAALQPGRRIDMEPLVRLSGMEHLLRDQYMDHRQSFI